MVHSEQARHDVDTTLLTKTCFYERKTFESPNLFSGAKTESSTALISIPVQVTVQGAGSRYVEEGKLNEGDLVGLFRHEYTQDSLGVVIDPKLVPKTEDRIKFLDNWYTIKTCVPATSEDDGIIGWDFTAGR